MVICWTEAPPALALEVQLPESGLGEIGGDTYSKQWPDGPVQQKCFVQAGAVDNENGDCFTQTWYKLNALLSVKSSAAPKLLVQCVFPPAGGQLSCVWHSRSCWEEHVLCLLSLSVYSGRLRAGWYFSKPFRVEGRALTFEGGTQYMLP